MRILGCARFDFEPQAVWFSKKIGSKTITQIFPNGNLYFHRNNFIFGMVEIRIAPQEIDYYFDLVQIDS